MSSASKQIVNIMVNRISDRLRDSQISAEAERNWVLPALNLRKEIWAHFPVVLNPLGNGEDGAERHAVCWHRTNLVSWRTEHPQPESWADYEAVTRCRLLRALAASTKWTVEPAAAPEQICVLRMNFRPRVESLDGSETHAHTRLPVLPALSVLLRLNDIKTHFPVVWHSLPSAGPDAKIYALELHTKKLSERKMNPDRIRAQLLAALHASTAWTVLPAEEGGGQVCRLQITTARNSHPANVPMA